MHRLWGDVGRRRNVQMEQRELWKVTPHQEEEQGKEAREEGTAAQRNTGGDPGRGRVHVPAGHVSQYPHITRSVTTQKGDEATDKSAFKTGEGQENLQDCEEA